MQEPAVDHARWTNAIDRAALHPVWGLPILAAAAVPDVPGRLQLGAMADGSHQVRHAGPGRAGAGAMAEGPLRSLLVDGVIAGAGSVLVFLPQILILFFFILALEDSGYLPRAAFLLDRTMGLVGLSGRSFIPLLSSFACAVPGVMATRTIGSWPRPPGHHHDRAADDLLGPAAGVRPADRRLHSRARGGWACSTCRGWCCSPCTWPASSRRWASPGPSSACAATRAQAPLLMELPAYRLPNPRSLAQGLVERASIFVRRVGGIILALTVVLWLLSSYPAPPAGAAGPAIQYSLAGLIGQALEPVFRPIGFNWQICIALIPGMAAREVAVGALGTVYALSATGEALSEQLAPDAGGELVAGHRPVAAGLVCVRAAMHLDAGGREARNPLVALSPADGRLPLRPGLPGVVHHLPNCAGMGGGMTQYLSSRRSWCGPCCTAHGP